MASIFATIGLLMLAKTLDPTKKWAFAHFKSSTPYNFNCSASWRKRNFSRLTDVGFWWTDVGFCRTDVGFCRTDVGFWMLDVGWEPETASERWARSGRRRHRQAA